MFPVRRRDTLLGAMLSLATLAVVPSAARAQAVQLAIVDVRAVAEGYQVSKLLNTRVDNEKNEKIGTLDDFIYTTDDKKLIGILQVGGFLGLGGYLIAVPFDNLKLSDDGKKFVLAGASKEELKKLPEFHFKK